MVICQDCKHFNLRDSPLGKHGFGLCKAKRLGVGTMLSASISRECGLFRRATEETIAKIVTAIGEP